MISKGWLGLCIPSSFECTTFNRGVALFTFAMAINGSHLGVQHLLEVGLQSPITMAKKMQPSSLGGGGGGVEGGIINVS